MCFCATRYWARGHRELSRVGFQLAVDRREAQVRAVPRLDRVAELRVDAVDLREHARRLGLLRPHLGRRSRPGGGRAQGDDHHRGDQGADSHPSWIRRRRPSPYTEPMQEVLTISNAVAAELAGMGDGVLDALRDRLDCTIRLRGNQLTLEGDDAAGRRGARGDRRARRARRGRPPDRRADRRRRARRARGRPGRPRVLRRRRLAPPRQADRAEDGHAEGLRRRDPPLARSPSGSGPPAPARPTSRWRSRSRRSRSARSRGSSSRGPRSRRRAARLPARATCSRRSTRTCARSSTRSTTCSTRTRRTPTWSAARSRSRRSRSCAAAR